jgi:tetratricopeptide (TPR) repeat protein
LAECYKATGKLREACRAYSKAIKRYPSDAKSLSGLGQVYGALGENLEIAIVLAKESTLLEPENGTFKKRLGELYLQAGQPNKALEELEKAVALGESCDTCIQKAKAEAAPTG